MSIINLRFKRKNAKPEVEVIRDAPQINPDSVQGYTVHIYSVFMDCFNWEVHRGGKRIGIDVSVRGGWAEASRKAEQFIVEHEFNGKIVNFDKVTYTVTVNRFKEG